MKTILFRVFFLALLLLALTPLRLDPSSGIARAGQTKEVDDARELAAEQSFSSIMQLNQAEMPARKAAGGLPAAAAPAQAVQTIPQRNDSNLPVLGASTETVEVPLERYESVRQRVIEARKISAAPGTPLVVLGASSYKGFARDGVLFLTLELKASLSGSERWKVVPVIGEEVVIVRAQAGTQPIALSTRDGYHVWVTQATGEITLRVELLVPPQGPRGSIEYDFLVARTPETRFACAFPTAGLEPRLRGTISAEVRPLGGGTSLEAWLSPTSRVHLVGFRDVTEEDGRAARLYAESLNLLSVSEGALDLFTVVRYNILYAGAREFQILLPEGFNLVSADAEGAFRYTTERIPEGLLLKGESAFPIRNSYEISLRLRQELRKEGATLSSLASAGEPHTFDVVLPRARNVEREYGWLGVEVAGNLKLEEVERGSALSVDVRQLPWVMVQSAVSPILKAWRIVDAKQGAPIRLTETRLPEKEPASASIDRIRALTVVSNEGRQLTDLRVTLRNRLRPSLSMRLPKGMSVRSSFLDGEAVRPSLSADGTLLFPLKRSAGVDSLVAFTLQVILESEGSSMWAFGRRAFSLPSIDLPVSTLHWDVALPARNLYSRLEGDIDGQVMAGAGHWYQPASGFVNPQANAPMNQELQGPSSASSGAMPVRIELPKTGRKLTWIRYWIAADRPVEVTTWYLRSWVRAPLGLLLFLGLMGGGFLFCHRWPARSRRSRLVAAGAFLFAEYLLYLLGGLFAATAGLLGFVLQFLAQKPGFAAILAWLRMLLTPTSQGSDPGLWGTRGALGKLTLVLASLFVLLMALIALLRLLFLLDQPLGG